MPSRDKLLAPVRPLTKIEQAYRDKLDAMIQDMHQSLVYWLSAALKKTEPEINRLMAEDASPAVTLASIMRKLRRRWLRNFNRLAPELADYFAEAVADRSDSALTSILRRGGMSVSFRRTRAVNDVLQATVQENVGLIKSIPQQYLAQVEGAVMRSVQRGRDLQTVVQELEQQLQVSRKRARLIARDQNNKATATIQRVRQAELGIREAIWMHSGAGKKPRPSHVQAGRDRVRYDITKGWYDPDEGKYVFPGELVNCRCVARPVIAGFT